MNVSYNKTEAIFGFWSLSKASPFIIYHLNGTFILFFWCIITLIHHTNHNVLALWFDLYLLLLGLTCLVCGTTYLVSECYYFKHTYILWIYPPKSYHVYNISCFLLFQVVECIDKKTGVKRALKVLHDSIKARREVELHWRASTCRYIVEVNKYTYILSYRWS